jgi:hypothetical protein
MLVNTRLEEGTKPLDLSEEFGLLGPHIFEAIKNIIAVDPSDLWFMHTISADPKSDPLEFEINLMPQCIEGPILRGTLRDVLPFIEEKVTSEEERDRIRDIAAALKDLAEQMIVCVDGLQGLEE